jgi:phage shock protein A
MSLLRRLATTLSAKANEILDHYDDPAEALDYEYQLLLEQVERVGRATELLATGEQALIFHLSLLDNCRVGLEKQAGEALREGRDGLAREALARCAVLRTGAASLAAEHDQIADEDRQFDAAAEILQDIVKIRGAKKESLKATYSVTGNRAEIESALAEMRDDVANIGAAAGRAEARSAQLRAQAERIDVLLASGALRDLSSSPEGIREELDEARADVDVERELERMKRAVSPRSSENSSE